MRTRQELERIEALSLAPYACLSANTRGRAFLDPETPYRTAFQRDRERILHTTAWRRLQGKTQVFVVTEGDYYRTRITHTLEVAQIGRTIARALGVNEDLVEGICLAHDLGHPPFGHSGEMTLNELMASEGGFNHNQHSFRVVTELESRYPEFPGLNLTYEMREGIVKHETDYDVVAEHDYETGLRGSVESQIACYADELAYNAHDTDDGLRAGLLVWDEVAAQAWPRRAAEAAGIAPGTPFEEMVRHRVIRKLIATMVTDLVDQSTRNLTESRVRSVDDVRRQPQNVIAFSEEGKQMNAQLKSFLYKKMYRHPRVLRMHSKAGRVLRDLFAAFMDEPEMMPLSAQQKYKGLPRPRAVCYYIAGMTDRFALDEHARLFDPRERV